MKNDYFEKLTTNKSRDSIYDDNYVGKQKNVYNEEFDADEAEDETYAEYDDMPEIKKNKHRFLKRLVAAVAVILIAIISISAVVSLFLPVKTNVLIMATDEEGTRTDTLMLANFNKKTKSISLLSVPRDSFVTVSDETYEKMNEEYPQPSSKSMKINAIHHYGGEKYGVKLLVNEAEALLDCDIDFYVKINFDAFKYIIDSVGGIDFYVPQNMEYHDPYQDLHISLSEGMQHLDGEQAEQVVRFRSGYANQDLGRVSVQQDFMKACISQIVTPKNLIFNFGAFINVLTNDNYVDTNVSLFSALPYAFQIIGVDTENMNSATLPGKAGYSHGQSVYKVDEDALRELVENDFK